MLAFVVVEVDLTSSQLAGARWLERWPELRGATGGASGSQLRASPAPIAAEMQGSPPVLKKQK